LLDKPLSPEKKRNKKREDAPELIRVSPNDKLLLTADKNGTLKVKSLSKEESKDEVSWSVAAHQDSITAISFVGGQNDLVASASSNASDACNIWKVGINTPAIILDRPSRLSHVFAINGSK
jgi:WD40 repeat protein